MKCEKCRNYQIDGDGCNESHHSACKSEKKFLFGKDKLSKEQIQKIMNNDNNKWNYCQGFERL